MKKFFLLGCAGCGCLIFILIIILSIFAFFFFTGAELKTEPSSTTWTLNQNISSI